MIQGLHHDVSARVRVHGKFSTPFKLTVGVKQGGVLSELLWCIYVWAIIELAHTKYRENNLLGINIMYSADEIRKTSGMKRKRRNIDEMNIYEILFVDDWLMMALSMQDLTHMMEIVLEILIKYGLTLSWKKTQMMIIRRKITSEINPIIEKLIVQNKCIE